LGSAIVVSVLTAVWGADKPAAGKMDFFVPSEASPVDSDSLRYPFHDRISDEYNTPETQHPMYLADPTNVKKDIEYDPAQNQYNINERIGNMFYRNPSYMTFEEFREHEFNNSTREYWRQRANDDDKLTKTAFAPKIYVNSEAFDRIFGGNTIDIRPQGTAELIFGINNSKNENPALPVQQRSVTTFDFKEKIQMNVVANIGDKMKLATNYNTEATFDFENKMKLEYTGHEDDIIKKIEAGNITFPIPSTLITGSQSLFGIKAQLQFGRLTMTSVYSEQKAQNKTINVQGGVQTTKFDIKADQYEANRHFFLAQYFRDQYESSLQDINQIRSGVNITRVEIWVRNTTSVQGIQPTRNIIALADLGEKNFDSRLSTYGVTPAGFPQPSDSSNNIYSRLIAINGPAVIDNMRDNPANATAYLGSIGMINGRNYVIQENARMLTQSEYTFNPLLGYISLSSELDPNKILAVAYEYTYNGVVHHVGELSSSGITGSKALFVKLLRSTTIDPSFYLWDLMMKNVYNLGGYQIKRDNFRLDVLYQNDQIGSNVNYIPEGCSNIKSIPLIKILGLDKLNSNNDPQPDGVFDFKEGITINSANGRVIFPVLEPFGSSLKNKFCSQDIPTISDKYIYQELYDTTRVIAQQHAEKNKFSLHGSYQSSASNDIPLNAVNVPQGSVKVTAGGVPLRENIDYTVDYTLGRVKIINDAYMKSNTPISVTLESQSLFSIQTKTMLGSRFDYYINKDFSLGATVLHLSERPITQKVNIGDEPISNTILGVDGTYRTESRFITQMLDKLPFYSTKQTSTITFSGETAKLFPGHSHAIGKEGISYIDDFEGAITPLDIKNPGQWFLASTPQGQHTLFPEDTVGLINGFNRAKTAWYYMDNIFQSRTNSTPDGITDDMMSNNYVREIQEPEIFPNKSQPNGPISIICTNVAYYPSERGPYNYTVKDTSYNGSTIYGIDSTGSLTHPDTRWGGIMRKVETTDFQNANIEVLQFWLMDPFADDSPNSTGGTLYFHLGDISEDVLRDNHKSYENGFNNAIPPKTTVWGYYPDESIPQIGYIFDNDPNNRQLEDIGLDGLNDNQEKSFFDSTYLQQVRTRFGPSSAAYNSVKDDPSNDDYHYFQGTTYNNAGLAPLERYKKYNGLEGNSPTGFVDDYQALGSQNPDYEDLNRDFTMTNEEQYFQYKIDLRPGSMNVGQNYITDVVNADIHNLPNGVTGRTVKWYQFKVPIKDPEKTIGYPNLTYISAIRMVMRGFSQPAILRFAKLEFLRSDWRKYDAQILEPGLYDPVPDFPGNTSFDLSYVSIQENSNRTPIHYVLPPGIEQERDITTTQTATLNEQSLVMKVCHMKDGEARAAYKTTQLDIRKYKKLKMYIHAESSDASAPLHDGDMTAFIRLGSDFTDNYYEYEIPLTITAPGDNGRDQVWPAQNNLEIDLNQLVDFKMQRNNAQLANPAVTLLTPYSQYITVNGVRVRMTVRGSPNLSNVRTLMIGLRNPRDPSGTGPDVCGEVWVNELRLSDFDEKGGWAATARVQAQLADLGTASIVGNHSTAGWGSLESKVSERDLEDKSSYTFATNLELGKFLPEKSGIKVPMYFEYSEQFIDPQYAPLDPDIIFANSLENAPSKSVRDSIQKANQDYTMRKSINFTNVKKTKTGKSKKTHIYDVENLSFTYAYTELYQRNYNVEYSTAKTYQGIIAYNYTNTPKSVEPFSKSKKLSSPYLKLIKDFNFNYMPTSLLFRTSLDRSYSETQLRNNSDATYKIDPTFIKLYHMTRNYGLGYDITKSLKFDFSGDATASIDEPPGKIDNTELHPGYTKKDSVFTNLKSLGRLTQYHHIGNLTYNVPLNKIPFLDWTNVTAKYSADYSWNTGALAYDNARQRIDVNTFQNTIQNSQTKSINGTLNFASLYNKSKYLKNINQPPPPKPQVPKPKIPKAPGDTTQKAVKDTLKKQQPSIFEPIVKGVLRLAMSVKTGSLTYTETNGTLLPGFTPRPTFLGQDFNYTNPGIANAPVSDAPGWAFLTGSQKDIRPLAVRNYWLTTDTALNSPFVQTTLQNFNGRIGLEPAKSFKIDITFNRNYTKNHSEYYRADDAGEFHTYNPIESGNFSISYLTWNTSFIKDQSNYSNSNFRDFSNYRTEISRLLAQKNHNSGGATLNGYSDGYGETQSEVLTYSFLSAYAGKSPSSNIIIPFPTIPMPNWRITYDGLSKLKFAQKSLQSFSISHGYRSIYSINSFTQNLLYQGNPDPFVRDTVGNFIPQYDFQQITIAEQFAPLIGLDMTWKNSLQTRFEIKRDRTLTLSYANIQVTEVRGTEYVVGLGYKVKRFKPPFVRKKLTNDLNLKADVGYRENTTIIRKLVEQANEPSAGSTTITVKVSADYNINERFNIKLFADKTINEPFVSTSFPTSNLNAGFSVRFTLAQ
jgi:cell surface protein SprA